MNTFKCFISFYTRVSDTRRSTAFPIEDCFDPLGGLLLLSTRLRFGLGSCCSCCPGLSCMGTVVGTADSRKGGGWPGTVMDSKTNHAKLLAALCKSEVTVFQSVDVDMMMAYSTLTTQSDTTLFFKHSLALVAAAAAAAAPPFSWRANVLLF